MRVNVFALLILVLLIILSYVKTYRLLFYSMIAVSPFTSVRVLQLPFASITLFQALSIPLVLYTITIGFRNLKTIRLDKQDVYILLFLMSIPMSIAVGATIEEGVFIAEEGIPIDEAYKNMVQHHIGITNITQSLYPIFGISIMYTVSKFASSLRRIASVIRIYVHLAFANSLFAVVYLFIHYTGGEGINDVIFRILSGVEGGNLVSPGGNLGIIRARTLVGEPGHSALFAIFGLSLLLFFHHMWSNRVVIIYTTVISLSLILFNSTTGFVGLAVLVSLSFAQSFLGTYRANKKTFGYLVATVAIIMIGPLATDIPLGKMVSFHIGKIAPESIGPYGSSALRYYSLTESLDIFYKRPFFGVGYGSHMSLMFVSFLLSNVGLFGTISFVTFCISLIIALYCKEHYTRINGKKVSYSYAPVFAILVLLMLGVSVSVVVFGWVWCAFGIARSLRSVDRRGFVAAK